MSAKERILKSSTSSTNHVKKFANGAVTRVWVSNFLTFSEFEMKPEPNLNLIIGPNGTGKSSLVNAIVLGLAGKPSVLGRAKQIVDYIQYGKDKAQLEIELHNENGPNWKIKRDILKSGNSNWAINGTPCTLKKVEELMSDLKIQVGNLCQFLPQDKVQDFAKMTKVELLQNTQKAAGSDGLYEQHTQLIDARTETQKLGTDVASSRQNLEQEFLLYERVKEQVQHNEQREAHLACVKLLKQKRAFKEYQLAKDMFEAKKNEHAARKTEIIKLKESFAPQERALAGARKKLKTSQSILSEMEPARNVDNMSQQLKNRLDVITEKMKDVKSEFEYKREEEKQRLSTIKSLSLQIAMHEEQLQACQTDNQGNQEKLLQVENEMRLVTQELNGLENKENEQRAAREAYDHKYRAYQQEIAHLEDVGRRREEMLRQYSPDTYTAVKWMRENKSRFKHNVYEPIVLNINMLNEEYAKCLESHIAAKDMHAFAFEDKEDRELFMREVSDNRKLRVNAVDVPSEPLSYFKPNVPLQMMRKEWGFQKYLKDVFQAPDGVMRYLCKQFNVHRVPVGNEETDKNMAQVVKDSNIRMFYTKNSSVNVRTSKYSRNQSTVMAEVRPARYLATSTNKTRINELQNLSQQTRQMIHTVESELSNLNQAKKDEQRKREELRTTMKKLKEEIAYGKSLIVRIRKEKERRDALAQTTFNLQEEEEKSQRKIKALILQKASLLETEARQIQSVLSLQRTRIVAAAQVSLGCRLVKNAENDLQSSQQSLKAHEDELRKLENEQTSLKNEAKNLLNIAKKLSDIPLNQTVPAELKQVFEKFPDDLESIDSKIFEEQTLANLLCPVDQSVLNEYEARRVKISVLEGEISRKSERLEDRQNNINNIKEQWLPALEDLIERINVNFSSFFSRLKCVGEITLDKSSNPDDYHNWGLNIRVKFRDSEPLMELTAAHHSGGEQSVATALYMLALQELTHVPFRCVDEINQGMDPENERKVFELITETACQNNNAQYFLLTPKLLPKLEYSENMKIFVIHNGAYFNCSKNWNIADFIQRSKEL